MKIKNYYLKLELMVQFEHFDFDEIFFRVIVTIILTIINETST